jgi:anti-anti-sigma regulatory factor
MGESAAPRRPCGIGLTACHRDRGGRSGDENEGGVMINIQYDAVDKTVVVDFKGRIDAAQAQDSYAELDRIVPRDQAGFKLLIDLTGVDEMEPEVENVMKKAMDLISARGVAEIFRVLPDPDMDIGFEIMSSAHYSPQVRVHTVRSRHRADAMMSGAQGADVVPTVGKD